MCWILRRNLLERVGGECPHRPADLPEDSNFLVQPHRNRPAEFARCTRCPPGACQRRLSIAVPDMLGFMAESLGTCRGRCLHRPADLPEDSNFLGQPHRNRPAEFARCTRCPPGACQRRLLPLPVSVMLIFKCFLVQVGNFISYGVCKLVLLGSSLGHQKGVPCAELASRRLD